MMNCPRIVIAGTHSGVGKTSLTLAIISSLRRRGLHVQTFKAGPDFLDPSHLALASARPCYNLDGWMMGRAYVCQLFSRASDDADIAVIEGVMGMFDGADPATLEGSTAQIALWLNAPVLLVVGVQGMARSLAALVKGYGSFEPEIKVAGVIANHCSSDRQADWLRESLKSSSLPPLVGAIPRHAFPGLPSRHLGLVTADHSLLPRSTLEKLAVVFETYGSIEKVMDLARSAAPLQESKTVRQRRVRQRPLRLGIAYDKAFHFYYQDFFDELERFGCELIRFSPIDDRHLPEGCQAIYLGGGYPEVFAEALSSNGEMLKEIRGFAASNRPIYAECGGLMYLSREIATLEDKHYPMAGLLPLATRMLNQKKSLGYVEITLNQNAIWGAEGTVLRGHEFHYSELTSDLIENEQWKAVYSLKRRRSDAVIKEGFQSGAVLASYTHLHLASHLNAVECFIKTMEQKY